MRSTKLVTTLVGMTLAATTAASAAYAMPIDPVSPPAVTRDASDVPPPPSSIAASAAEEYEALRAPSGPRVSAAVAVDEPSAPAGFDWVSAMIGAAAAAGLSFVYMAAVGVRHRHTASA